MYNSGRKKERLKQQAFEDWRPLNARLKSLVYYFDSGLRLQGLFGFGFFLLFFFLSSILGKLITTAAMSKLCGLFFFF